MKKDKNKDKVIDVEVVEEKDEENENQQDDTKKDERKKENPINKLWGKTKSVVSETLLEQKLEAAFKKHNQEFTYYSKNSLLGKSLRGYYVEDKVVVFGERILAPYNVLIDEDLYKPFYIVSTEIVPIFIELDGITYERKGTKITLDPEVEEVKVIKAGPKYYIYKGK